ncbi:MAG: methyltransferase [Terriglobales bacterium]|jgi:hypothetical protein
MTPTAAPAAPTTSSAQRAALGKLMQVTNAFLVSRCLYVVAETGVADHLNDAPQSSEALAKATGSNAGALHRVLRVLASHGIFDARDGSWSHTDMSRFLRSDHPASMRDYIRMIGMPVFWRAWEHIEHSVRTGETGFKKVHPGGAFAYLAEHPEESSLFNAAMTAKSHGDIAAVLPAYDFSQFATIADIAGGRGHLLRAILKQCPNTQGILFDQPHVVSEVSPHKGEKLSVVAGSFFTDKMPTADCYVLMNIIHDWADAESIKILSAIRRDMPQHARVLLIESVVPSSPEPHLSKELDIVMMVLPGGRERTKEEYADLVAKCGLRLKRVIDTKSPYSIVEIVAA